MICWEWEKEADKSGNIVWDTYDCIISFIIESRYQLFTQSKFNYKYRYVAIGRGY